MLLKCSECSETWNKAIQFFSPLWPPPTLDILPGCWPRPHVLTFVKISKNTQMNFPYHTESISQHVHHFKPIKFFLEKKLIIFREIINLIFEPFPNLISEYPMANVCDTFSENFLWPTDHFHFQTELFWSCFAYNVLYCLVLLIYYHYIALLMFTAAVWD